MKYTVNVPVEVEVPDNVFNKSQYNLLYRKLSGDENVYKLNEIVFMDNRILKAVVEGRGYRSFRTDRIVSMMPI